MRDEATALALDPRAVAELRRRFKYDDFYLSLMSPSAASVLQEMIEHPRFPGATEPPVLTLLAALLRVIEPRRVLQIGTYIGFSTVFLADILSRNRQPGHLVTVEPDATAHESARAWAEKAQLADAITFLDGRSTDVRINRALQPFTPFDLIYLDSSHAYEETLEELTVIFERGLWLSRAGVLVLHDAALSAKRWDPTRKGGVRRALEEWVNARAHDYQILILEPPLLSDSEGLGLVTRRQGG